MWEAVLWPLVIVFLIAVLFALSVYLVRLGLHEREDEWRWEEASEGPAPASPDAPHAA